MVKLATPKSVKLKFITHAERDKYPKVSGVLPRTHIFETGWGRYSDVSLKELERKKWKAFPTIPWDISRLMRLIALAKSGVRITPGERLKTRMERLELGWLIDRANLATDKYLKTRNLGDFKEHIKAWAAFNGKRHELIRRTIKGLRKKSLPAEAVYGVGHSLLAGELAKEGVETSVEIAPQVFSPYDVAIRLHLSGVTPSERQYKEALACCELDRSNSTPRTEQESIFRSALYGVLTKRLTDGQLDQFVNERLQPSVIYGWNGLHRYPTEEEQEEFLLLNSPFWRRKMGTTKSEVLKQLKAKID
jgi:hypothetical protein